MHQTKLPKLPFPEDFIIDKDYGQYMITGFVLKDNLSELSEGKNKATILKRRERNRNKKHIHHMR